jgi:hypothetical protein
MQSYRAPCITKGGCKRGLVSSIARVAREGDDVADVADARGKHDQPLKAQTKATVWH